MRSLGGFLLLTILVTMTNLSSLPAGEVFTFAISDAETKYSGGVAEDLVVTVTITEDPFGPDYPQETEGFQMGIAFDDAHVSIVEPKDGADLLLGILADFDDGDGPAFFNLDFDPANGPGLTVAAVFDPFGGGTIAFENPEDVFELTIQADTEWLAEGGDLTTELEFVDDLGVPEHLNQVVIEGKAQFPDYDDATLTYTGIDSVYVRGDLDGDGKTGLLDAFTIILALFADGDPLTCEAAADLNEDEMVSTDDILHILEYAFTEGPPPPAPWPDCGAGSGTCASYDYCD